MRKEWTGGLCQSCEALGFASVEVHLNCLLKFQETFSVGFQDGRQSKMADDHSDNDEKFAVQCCEGSHDVFLIVHKRCILKMLATTIDALGHF